MKYKVLFWSGLLALAACANDQPSSNGEKLTKAQYQAQAKADGVGPDEVCFQLYGYECDLCAEFDWYGDGTCDEFCSLPDDDCGTDPDGGPAYDPCSGLSCGTQCSLCDPSDPSCIETAVVKYCDENGTCQGAGIPYCDDAIGPDAGVDADPAHDPCSGLSCGAQCSLCDPSDPNCVETPVLKFCDASGVCGATTVEPDCSDTYDPCAGKSCGDFCNPFCDPADPQCTDSPPVVTQCNEQGACTTDVPTCATTYEPCAGKSCGDDCSLCDPADPTCVETAVLKACDASGRCSGAIPQCTQP